MKAKIKPQAADLAENRVEASLQMVTAGDARGRRR
jgi:hypothetical protein